MTDRTPYCHKIRYGITGAPTLTEDEMDGSHAPGIGVAPSLIELVYSAARDGKPASVSASVTGAWTRFGERADGQVTAHFADGPDSWPDWLAEEARLHDPAAVSAVAPATDQTALRDRIAEALYAHDHPGHLVPLNETGMEPAYRESADAVLSVLPASVDRADVYAEVADRLAADAEQGEKEGFTRIYRRSAAKQVREWGDELRRMAAESVPADTGPADGETRHVGGVAEDCPACSTQGIDTLSYPGECPGPEQAAAGAQQPKETQP
jgi:hypothetical protein